MGLIRKSLYLTTGGLVAPNSRKQRVQMQQLAAMQGATDEEIRRRGSRGDAAGFLGLPPESVAARQRQARQRAKESRQQGGTTKLTAEYRALHVPGSREYQGRIAAEQALPDGRENITIGLECGHMAEVSDPRVARWLSVPDGEVSYHCATCGADRAVEKVIEPEAIAAGGAAQDTPAAGRPLRGGPAADGGPGRDGDHSSPAAGSTVITDLERLAKLHAAGALTQAEFLAAKAKLLGI
jgi:hypothetical protein